MKTAMELCAEWAEAFKPRHQGEVVALKLLANEFTGEQQSSGDLLPLLADGDTRAACVGTLVGILFATLSNLSDVLKCEPHEALLVMKRIADEIGEDSDVNDDRS